MGKKRFETKDSGVREEYASGMRRDTQEDKPRFDLLLASGVDYHNQFLTHFAGLLERGARKYGERNWELASSQEELGRFRASALRHMMQWACGEEDEDHAAAVAFNLMAYETLKARLDKGGDNAVSGGEDGGPDFNCMHCGSTMYFDSPGYLACTGCTRTFTGDALGRLWICKCENCGNPVPGSGTDFYP